MSRQSETSFEAGALVGRKGFRARLLGAGMAKLRRIRHDNDAPIYAQNYRSVNSKSEHCSDDPSSIPDGPSGAPTRDS
jgi:hypothetical protein